MLPEELPSPRFPKCGGDTVMLTHNATFYPDALGKMVYAPDEGSAKYRCLNSRCAYIFERLGNESADY